MHVTSKMLALFCSESLTGPSAQDSSPKLGTAGGSHTLPAEDRLSRHQHTVWVREVRGIHRSSAGVRFPFLWWFLSTVVDESCGSHLYHGWTGNSLRAKLASLGWRHTDSPPAPGFYSLEHGMIFPLYNIFEHMAQK